MAGLPVVIRGELYRSDVSVGGGPVLPEGGPGDPPGIWGGSNEGFPTHPIIIPPGFIDGVYPEHPIVIPPPPSIWPGRPAHPIVIPPDIGIWPDPPEGSATPEHPIVIPPPPTMWPPRPVHPIVLPPDGPPQPLPQWEVKTYWTAEGGWAVALVPTEAHPGLPTPSTAPTP